MKKTLIICGRYPLPEDHGSPIRTMNFVRFFRKYGRVDIAYSAASGGEQEGKNIFSKAYFLKKNEFPLTVSGRLKRMLSIHKTPLPIEEVTPASAKELLDRLHAEDYDYIFTRYVINSSILFKLPEKYRRKTIIDFDDIMSNSLYDSMYGEIRGWHKKMVVVKPDCCFIALRANPRVQIFGGPRARRNP